MSIDTKKMKALAEKLREDYRNSIKVLPWPYRSAISSTPMEAADAIDLLLAEVEASDQKRKEAILDAEKARDERNRAHVKLNAEWIEKTNALRAELEAAAADKRAAKKPDAMTKAVKQLADWLLTDPNEGNPLCFAGPPEPFVLGLSRVKMRSIAGDEWTLIAGLQEGWLNAEQRAANFWRIAKLEREEVAREEAVAALAQRQGEGS